MRLHKEAVACGALSKPVSPVLSMTFAQLRCTGLMGRLCLVGGGPEPNNFYPESKQTT